MVAPDRVSDAARSVPDALVGGTVRLIASVADAAGHDAERCVNLDTTWTARAAAAESPRVVSVRDIAAALLAKHDLIADTSAHLDRWADASGVVDRLTIGDTSFWFYVRLRHWSWLQERILWAGIAERIVSDHRPARVVTPVDVDEALMDVLRLMAADGRFELVEERAAEPPTPAAATRPPAGRKPAEAAATNAPPSRVSTSAPRPAAPGGRPTSSRRGSPLSGIARRIRNRLIGPPPPPPHVIRRRELQARRERVHELVAALDAEPERRLLVVHEHARQIVQTEAGLRSLNPYLDPIVDRLRGTNLEPITLDIRAQLGNDAAWARLGAGLNPRSLPIDALTTTAPAPPAPPPPDRPAPAETPVASAPENPETSDVPAVADAAPASDEPPPTTRAAPTVDPALAAWRDSVDATIPAFGLDLGPMLTAEVARRASLWLPGMSASIDRITGFLERTRPAGIVLADEYHRQDWMAAARRVGIPVAAVQHGLIYRHHQGYIHAHRPDTLRLPARTYVFGRWERDLLRTASVYRDEEVVVGGSPRLDLVAVAPQPKRDLRHELGVADGDRLVVLSGTWGGLYRRFQYPIALAALFDRPMPGVHVVVKLHPGEPDEGPYRAIIEGAAAAGGFPPPKVSTVTKVDLYALLAAADAHLGIHSTVLTEAVVTRTPNILAAGLAGSDLLGYVEAGVAIPVRDGSELLAALDQTAGGLDESRAATFVTSHFEPGVASDRIAADLVEWLG